MEAPAGYRVNLDQAAICAGVEGVRERIARACQRSGRDVSAVVLVAATKSQPPEALALAWQAGIRDFGENRVQESVAKQPVVEALLAAAVVRWHLIGRLQSNKAKVAAERFAILHAVDSVRVVELLSRHGHGAPLPIMIEVNVAADPARYGVLPGGLSQVIEVVRSLPSLELAGLMTVPPRVERAELARPYFAALRGLATEHGVGGLSMGMTEDFEVAIEEGATHVRVGRAIFGERTA